MGICIGIANILGNRTILGKSTIEPLEDLYNIITEDGRNILSEELYLILRDMNNIITEDNLVILTENKQIIILE